MPLQNRVNPYGDIVATPHRGLFMGNRGILHRNDRVLGQARWRHRNWVTCLLDFQQRRRVPMTPGRYTELFFLDEATALAAGHRPCAECRRADFRRFSAAWAVAHGGSPPRAPEMDAALHAARLGHGRQRTVLRNNHDLPDGTFIDRAGEACLVVGSRLLAWSSEGYRAAAEMPSGPIRVLTPEPTLRVLAAGYRPILHPSAGSGL